jgi:hypothetical protein
MPVTSEVEERIHKALQSHPLERFEQGYRRVHPGGAGTSVLRLVPVVGAPGSTVIAIAEIIAEYAPAALPAFHEAGVERLNAMAVHGAYRLESGQLRQTAQVSIHSNEPDVHLTVQSILNAFGGQLPIGRSVALSTASAAVLKQQRAHHKMPGRWRQPLEEAALNAVTTLLQQRGLAASNDSSSAWAELPLSGECPSRSIDPQAETALLQVNTAVPHPIAGAGYLATLYLPITQAPAHSGEICRRLNALELEQVDFVPRLGAWGLHGPRELPGYSCFIPAAEPFGGMHVALMWWSVLRAAWLRDQFWQPQIGLTLDAVRLGARSADQPLPSRVSET